MTANKADDIISKKANVTICCEAEGRILQESAYNILSKVNKQISSNVDIRIWRVADERAKQ